jgi:hypothetical protein
MAKKDKKHKKSKHAAAITPEKAAVAPAVPTDSPEVTVQPSAATETPARTLKDIVGPPRAPEWINPLPNLVFGNYLCMDLDEDFTLVQESRWSFIQTRLSYLFIALVIVVQVYVFWSRHNLLIPALAWLTVQETVVVQGVWWYRKTIGPDRMDYLVSCAYMTLAGVSLLAYFFPPALILIARNVRMIVFLAVFCAVLWLTPTVYPIILLASLTVAGFTILFNPCFCSPLSLLRFLVLLAWIPGWMTVTV